MSEISKLIAEIKSEGILRAGNKLEQLYSAAIELESDYAALQQKLDALAGRLQAEMQTSDIIMESLRQREVERDALAAENAALKEFGDKLNDMHNILNGEGTGIQGRAEVACQQVALEAAMEEFDTIKTPVTDAYLNSVRAEGVEKLLNKYAPYTIASSEASEFAARLRSGTHDTADKAG